MRPAPFHMQASEGMTWLSLSMEQVDSNLVVLNLSQQTDSADLLGGFQPVEPRHALLPLLEHFQVTPIDLAFPVVFCFYLGAWHAFMIYASLDRRGAPYTREDRRFHDDLLVAEWILV